jgi:hypothetical protein
MRSMAGPAAAGRRLVKSDIAKNALAVGAAGEMMFDKHPAAPNRTSPPALMGRVMMGAATGAAIVVSGQGASRRATFLRSRRRRPWLIDDGTTLTGAAVGALIGGAAAAVATHASFHARKWVTARTDAPGAAVGAGEDVLVYATAILLAGHIE